MHNGESIQRAQHNRPGLLLSPPDHVRLSRSPHPYHRSSVTKVGQDEDHPSQDALVDRVSRSDSTESGTEADDERGPTLKSLPAPPARSHKGLKGSTPFGLSPTVSPLPSPKATTLQDTIQETLGYFGPVAEDRNRQDEDSVQREAYIRRKKGEIVRRATETLLLFAIGILTFSSVRHDAGVVGWYAETGAFMIIPPVIYALYPLRKILLAYRACRHIDQAVAVGIHLPSRFDPGPLLYPVVLPVIVALSVANQPSAFVPVNIVCGLSSIPAAVTGVWHQPVLFQFLLWMIPVLPMSLARAISSSWLEFPPFSLKVGSSKMTVEDLVMIPLLHQYLKPALHYMTTTSLDPAELELLATSLIDLLFLSSSPQAELLTGLLWVGGISIFLCCRYFLEAEVELARLPKWKLASGQTDPILTRIRRALSALKSAPPLAADSSDDELDTRTRLRPLQRMRTLAPPAQLQVPNGAANPSIPFRRPGRRSTISSLDPRTKQEVRIKARQATRTPSAQHSRLLSLTLQEVKARKFLLAAAVYVLVLVIILGPTRLHVSKHALSGYEPFGWAIGYLFGNLPPARWLIIDFRLNHWIPLPTSQPAAIYGGDLLRQVQQILDQPGNLRLALFGYCLLVLLSGMAVVLSLTSYIEVDTRRKGFHGVMVLMLLPTIFFDPCFFALALALILAAFLLLDLFRASQLPPISRPLTNFLAPYVDGRDHRGPVIVSHIFLLIGCAIPLWLSLSGLSRTGDDPWQGWDVPERNLSMVSGVICVGMGDAAASLIGRRYGKIKWYWGGGKSLEGSAAFAVAVTVGLMFGYTWLRVGGWVSCDETNFSKALLKCMIAGSGASLLETVLTAANDNVVVPIGLWLLVRGLEI